MNSFVYKPLRIRLQAREVVFQTAGNSINKLAKSLVKIYFPFPCTTHNILNKFREEAGKWICTFL